MPYTNGGWTVAVPKLYNSSPVIRRIMLAVCRTMEGQTSGRERDREEGLRYYTSSLSTMAGALRNPGKVDHAVLVVAARLFSMYEVSVLPTLNCGTAISKCSRDSVLFASRQVHCGHNSLDLLAQAENWRKHIQGELALIMSRPPETYASGYLHQLWVDGRLHLVRFSQDIMTPSVADPPSNPQASCFLQMRKRAPMSGRDWMTIPWQTMPKTPKDLLVDILIATTGLLEDYDILGAQKEPNLHEALRQELVQTCWRLDAELALWVNTAHFGDANRALEVLNAPFSIDVLAAAHIMSIYWCACIVTYSTLRDLLSPSEIARLPPYTDPRTYFRSIADVVTVMLHPSSGIFGAQLTYFPAAIVMAYIRPVGGGDEAEAVIFNAYRRAGKDEIVESFLTSLREQEMSRSSGTLGLAPLKSGLGLGT
jgi:hypothetical protein